MDLHRRRILKAAGGAGLALIGGGGLFAIIFGRLASLALAQRRPGEDARWCRSAQPGALAHRPSQRGSCICRKPPNPAHDMPHHALSVFAQNACAAHQRSRRSPQIVHNPGRRVLGQFSIECCFTGPKARERASAAASAFNCTGLLM